MTFAAGFFAVLTLLAALGVILASKPLHSALFLVVTLFLIAAHYAILGAHFVAAAQVLIYAGAIMVLVIFVIMLLGLERGEVFAREKALRFSAPPVVLVFAALVGFAFWGGPGLGGQLAAATTPRPDFGTIQSIATVLFGKHVFSLQIVGLLLLSAMIGAVVLALEAKRPLGPGRGLKAKREELR